MIESPETARPPSTGSLRELQAAREIAHAFLRARAPGEVYNLALEKVVPLVGAAFASVFLRQPEDDLLRVVAVHNWPQAYASYLSEMRVRIGNGPTGRAVAENRVIEIFDVFADPALEDWWDAARELDYASSVSLPLVTHTEPAGAITFYFREPERLSEADRSLLRLVADQLAATAEKAYLIEDLQRANEKLREQNVELEARYREADEARRLKSEFLANVSHELRTPLTAILGFAYLLREGFSGALHGEQAASIARIESAANTLMVLINDLLDLTHLTLGRTTVEPEECDATALARAALSAARPSVVGAEVRTQAAPEPISVRTDPVHVLRILQNLISNAFKFTPNGQITIRVRKAPAASDDGSAEDGSVPAAAGGDVIWEIEDTGIGIAPTDQEAIFDEFRQVDGSATRRYGGTGLGLALSRALARRLGGDISVRSELGTGSVFSLCIPRQPAGASVASAPPEAPNGS